MGKRQTTLPRPRLSRPRRRGIATGWLEILTTSVLEYWACEAGTGVVAAFPPLGRPVTQHPSDGLSVHRVARR